MRAILRLSPRYFAFLMALLMVALVVFYQTAQLHHLFGWYFMASDDSYIYLGYVRNWVERGEFLTYNPGEHSAGTTGLLYYYLLSSVASIVHLAYWPSAGTALTLVAYITNTLLFGCAAFLVVRIWHSLSGTQDFSLSFMLQAGLLWMAVIASPSFLWGWFGGLENPLSGTLLLLLLERALVKAPAWQVAIASAMLAGSRPELAPFGLLVTALWAIAPVDGAGGQRKKAGKLGSSLAAFFAVLLAIYLPCWFSTGSLTPSALGTRVAIPALTNPALLWENMVTAARAGYFTGYWVAGGMLVLCGAFLVSGDHAGRVLKTSAALLVFYFLMRGCLGLTDFNVEDRYVSFFWPLYVLTAAYVLQHTLGQGWNLLPVAVRQLFILAGSFVVMAGGGWGIYEANSRLLADVAEINRMHVLPSMWMAKHLPESSRIVMEPAGAIRVFTNFYLIDADGLTTNHAKIYLALPPGKADFFQQTGATHIFDYPIRMPFINSPRFERLWMWSVSPSRHSGGVIGLYAIKQELAVPAR